MATKAPPKPQAYPAGTIKVGAVLWSVLVWTDDDTGRTSTEYHEWHVRSIKARRGSKSLYGIKHGSFLGDDRQQVNLTRKLPDVTWVKIKGKTGWAKSIPAWLRRQFVAGSDLPLGLYTTQRAALVYAIRVHQGTYLRYEKWIAQETDPEEKAALIAERGIHEAEMRALATRFTKQFGSKAAGPRKEPE